MNNKQLNIAKALIEKELSRNTRASAKRATEMSRYLTNHAIDSGAFGRIRELANHSDKSHKKAVARQGKADTYIKVNINGKTAYKPVEVKTNGGRITNLLSAQVPFVVYSMCVHNSLCDYDTKQKLFKTSTFVEMLEKCNAIKNTNGTNPELAIQCANKKLFIAVSEHPTNYEPDKIYNLDEIG